MIGEEAARSDKQYSSDMLQLLYKEYPPEVQRNMMNRKNAFSFKFCGKGEVTSA